jgi:hypothetical protein
MEILRIRLIHFTCQWKIPFIKITMQTIDKRAVLKITIVLEGRAIYGNLENKINTIYWPVENSIHKNNDADDG